MIQFNLLPDVKLEFVKAQRTKHLMTFVSFVAGGAALAILLFSLFIVHVVQKKSISDLNKDITASSNNLKNIKNLDKILTVQNQLSTLTSLHDSKPVTSRLFGYISQVTPSEAHLSKLTLDYAAGTLSIGGTAPSLDVVSLYTDTLKATRFTTTSKPSKARAFTDVVMSSFSRNDQGATFNIDMKFEPSIFQQTEQVQLVVPANVGSNQDNLFGATN